jgi:hypothetical protein
MCQPPAASIGRRSLRPPLFEIRLVILVLMMIGVVPAWPHSRSWGYAPSGTLGLLLVILLLLTLTGRI